MSQIEFYVDDETLTGGGTKNIWVNAVRAFAETRWSDQTMPIIYVRAKDANGNWGPTSAILYSVTRSNAGSLGPVTVVAGTTPEKVTDGLSTVLLTANVDDGVKIDLADNGGSRVADAEYFIGTPGTGGTGTPMTPVDGIWDSMAEAVLASVDVSGWDVNTEYTIYVHGKDAAGNWGPFYEEKIMKTEAQGPRIKNISASPNPVAGSSITVRAIADETDTGRGKITAAEYFMDIIVINNNL